MEKPRGSEKLQKSSQNSDLGGNLKKFGLFSVIIGELIGFTGAGIGLGYLAWAKWGAPWWVLLLSSSAGLCLAIVQVYRISQRQ